MFWNQKGTQKEGPAAKPEDFFETPNKAACVERLEAVLTGKKSKGAVIKIYVENFKFFNDTFGYSFGGLLLREIAQYLCSIPGGDVYRIGGVEFAVIMENYNLTKLQELGDQIAWRFEESWTINDIDCMCSVNMGGIVYNGEETAEGILEDLEYAVQESPEQGSNQLAVCDSEMKAKLARRFSIAKAIPEALEKGNIEIRYRPTKNMASGQFTRAECYLRLSTEEYGMINAAEFLPIAEEAGQSVAINNYVIDKACQLIRELLDDNRQFETIAVPISAVQLLQERFPMEVENALGKYAIPPGHLAFEIKESMLLTSFSRVTIVMQELSDMGIEWVLNEFGTGYSGINSVLSMPVDVLKLERMFVWQLETNERSCHVIEGLIQIANRLGLKIIAEGVETENQVKRLAEYGCPYEQGFYYSATVLPHELRGMFPAAAAVS